MRLYYEIALRSFRRATTYRSAYIAGLLTNSFFGALRSFVYIAIYGAGGSVAGFTLSDAISYSWVTQALISIGAGWIISRELMESIKSGDVVTDLSRPWSFYGYWLSQSLGERGFNLLLRGSLTYLIGALYFRAHIPTLPQALGFAASLALAAIARVLPFQGISGLPAQIFLGQLSGAALARALLLQLFWCVLLVAAGLLLLRAAVRKVVIQGG